MAAFFPPGVLGKVLVVSLGRFTVNFSALEPGPAVLGLPVFFFVRENLLAFDGPLSGVASPTFAGVPGLNLDLLFFSARVAPY